MEAITKSEQQVINFLFHTKLGYLFICFCILGLLNLGFNIFGVKDYFILNYNIGFALATLICSFFVKT